MKKQLIKKLLNLSPTPYKDLIKQGIEYADQALKGDKRLSGEDLIIHSLNTAIILAKLSCDTDTILAGVLHSSFAKDDNTKEDIKNKFGTEIHTLITLAKQISQATGSMDTDPEIITKFILNNSKDLRPILIKLASAANNVETLEYLPEDLRKKKIHKAFDIYGKLAEYLNLGKLKKQIEENAFERYKPEEFKRISDLLEREGATEESLELLKDLIESLAKRVDKNISVEGRIKSKYSIYNKLKKYEKEWISPRLEEIDDIVGFRIITQNNEDCFNILEKVMDHGILDIDNFEDYISNPKPNNYQALQGPVKFPTLAEIPVEIQILTEEMHYTNTYGTASHIAYKASKSRFAKPDSTYSWVECIHRQFEKHKRLREEKRSIPIECEIFKDEKFIRTPKGEIIAQSLDETVLDFAFKIHSEIGYSAVAAKMDGQAIPLSYIPKTGDVIQVVTQKGKTKQKESMLKLAKSASTRAKILQRL
jgi:guanosine-3',5'-bis(diphosphate) 3'-pyrophosphohydrolase